MSAAKQWAQDALDADAIGRVQALRHRIGGSPRSCECEDCEAIKRVCVLAREAVEMKAARRRSA
jgi:hypothetical protein